jgi:hypothetical protein
MIHGDENYFTTISGRRFWPLDPREGDVDIEDIAHALALQCRFNGHVCDFYSVAQHSVIVSHHVAPSSALHGLLHDAAEAYIGDMTRVLKHDPSMKLFKDCDNLLTALIYKRFGLSPIEPVDVKQADVTLLQDEVRCVALHPEQRPLYMQGPGFNLDITPWGPSRAKEVFLWRFDQLRQR